MGCGGLAQPGPAGPEGPEKRPGASPPRAQRLPQAAVPAALRLTLVPIWFPHWPAWMCTISLMAMPDSPRLASPAAQPGSTRRRESGRRFMASEAARAHPPPPPPPAPPRRGDSPRPTAGAPRARSANGRPPAGHRPQGPLTSSSSAVRGTVSGGEGGVVSGPTDCCLSVLCFPLKPCSPKAGSSSSPTVETCPGRGRAGGRTSSPAPVVPWPACPVATFAGVAASKAMGGPSQCLANGHLCIAVF